MTQAGWTRSIFAIRFLGRPEEARKAIVNDRSLRRRFLIEQYIISALAFGLGIVAIFTTQR
jgi:hypothetical protein